METSTLNNISALSSTSRVWAFQSSKLLDAAMLEDIHNTLSTFLHDWAAHGRQLFAAYEIRFNRFIIIAVDEEVAQATGCSVDKLMHTIQHIDTKHDLDLLNRMKVAYRHGEEIIECDVNTFSELLKTGAANDETFVFNNVVQTVEELSNQWETQVKHSWHANLLP